MGRGSAHGGYHELHDALVSCLLAGLSSVSRDGHEARARKSSSNADHEPGERSLLRSAYGMQVPFTQWLSEAVQSTHGPPVLTPHAVSAVPAWHVPPVVANAAVQQPPLHPVSFGPRHSVVQRSMPASRQASPPLCSLAAGQSVSEALHPQ